MSIPQTGNTNPDPLGQLTDQLVADLRALLPPDKQEAAEQFGRTLSNWMAELIGRAAAQAASISTPIIRKVDDLERRERGRSERAAETERTVNGRVDALHNRVDALEKAVNDDASNAAGPTEP